MQPHNFFSLCVFDSLCRWQIANAICYHIVMSFSFLYLPWNLLSFILYWKNRHYTLLLMYRKWIFWFKSNLRSTSFVDVSTWYECLSLNCPKYCLLMRWCIPHRFHHCILFIMHQCIADWNLTMRSLFPLVTNLIDIVDLYCNANIYETFLIKYPTVVFILNFVIFVWFLIFWYSIK